MWCYRCVKKVSCVSVLLKVCSGASVDRFESDKPRTTEVSLFHTSEKTNITGLQADNRTSVGDDDYEEDYEGDYELNMPRGRFFSLASQFKIGHRKTFKLNI